MCVCVCAGQVIQVVFYCITYDCSSSFICVTSTSCLPPLPVLTIAFNPVGPIVLDEGQNFTLVCDASRGGHLQLLKDSSKVAEVVGDVLRYPLVFVNKEHVGQYTCQLEEVGSVVVTTTIKVEVRGVYSVCLCTTSTFKHLCCFSEHCLQQ